MRLISLTLAIASMSCAAVAATAVDVPATSRPNPKTTPGVTRELSLDVVCTTKWGLDKRAVTAAMKTEVFHRYGFSGNQDPKCTPDAHGATCEIDHLVSRELAGADDVNNLWPQPYGGRWNAHDKDRLENALHKAVCVTHTMTLEDAQTTIRTDWIAAYLKMFGQPGT